MTEKERFIIMLNNTQGAYQKHTELAEFKERLEFLEEHLEKTISTNDTLWKKVSDQELALAEANKYANTYKLIIEKVNENEVLQPLWSEFLMAMKMACDDIEQEFDKIQKGQQ